jgi:hypothetical protein
VLARAVRGRRLRAGQHRGRARRSRSATRARSRATCRPRAWPSLTVPISAAASTCSRPRAARSTMPSQPAVARLPALRPHSPQPFRHR